MVSGGIVVHLDTRNVTQFALALDAVGGAVGSKAATAVKKTAADIESDAKAFCPVDTGTLRSSISTSITGDGRFAGISAEVGPTAEYGIYVEYGTSKMAPEAFLGPAFDRHAHELETALGQIGLPL